MKTDVSVVSRTLGSLLDQSVSSRSSERTSIGLKSSGELTLVRVSVASRGLTPYEQDSASNTLGCGRTLASRGP